MPATITKAFIPRVLPNVTISQIRDVFAAKQIGKVTNIDMRHRKNEKNNRYSFVFLEIALYNTKEATDLNEAMTNNEISKVFYDMKNYWEVKSFISRSQRISMITFPEEPNLVNIPDSLLEEPELEEIPNICFDLLTPPVSSEQTLLRMSMHSQLLHSHHTREIESKTCYNCGEYSDPEYVRSIFWKNYAFCSEKCQYESEWDMRKSWCKSQQKPEPVVLPKLNLNDYNTTTTSSEPVFINMFQRIQDEEPTEMQDIRNICYDLMKRPSVFTVQDRKEMEQDYEELLREIMA